MAETCTGAWDCAGDQHVHGCHADYGNCDNPEEHKRAVDHMFTKDWQDQSIRDETERD